MQSSCKILPMMPGGWQLCSFYKVVKIIFCGKPLRPSAISKLFLCVGSRLFFVAYLSDPVQFPNYTFVIVLIFHQYSFVNFIKHDSQKYHFYCWYSPDSYTRKVVFIISSWSVVQGQITFAPIYDYDFIFDRMFESFNISWRSVEHPIEICKWKMNTMPLHEVIMKNSSYWNIQA